MKNLGTTIDRIIKVDPALGEQLSPIKNKWRKYPSKVMAYWKELLDILNSNPLLNHPNRDQFRNIIQTKIRPKRKYLYTFEPINPADHVIGLLPENMADMAKKIDFQTLETAKLNMEANFTRNEQLAAEVARKEAVLDIKSKHLWVTLRDYFQLWSNMQNISIKFKNNVLVLVMQHQPSIPLTVVGPGLVKMDSQTLKQFLQFLGGSDPSQNPDEGKK